MSSSPAPQCSSDCSPLVKPPTEDDIKTDSPCQSRLTPSIPTSLKLRSTPVLRSSKRKLIYDQNKENTEETSKKKVKNDILHLAADGDSQFKVQNVKTTGPESDHTPQWLRMRLSDQCSLEERREKLREYRASLYLDLRSSELDTNNMKVLKSKDEIIDKLKMRIAELQSQIDSTGEGESHESESVGLKKLLQQLQKAQDENCQLASQVTQLETSEMKWKSNYRILNDETRELRTENDSFSNQANRQIAGLEDELCRVKAEKAKTAENMKKLKEKSKQMKAELQEKIEEQKKAEHRFTEELSEKESTIKAAEQQAIEDRTKRLELAEMVVKIVDRPPEVDQDAILLLGRSIALLKRKHQILRDCVKDMPAIMNDIIQATTVKMQDAIRETNQTNQDLVRRYTREIQLRKRYHNQLVELRGNIRVFCRVRPGHTRDQSLSFDSHDDGMIRVNHKGRNQSFEFDKVFNTGITQSQVFEEVSDLIRSVLDGFNVCIFAYGQTGSGKTYTMEGPPQDPGINQRALRFLYEQARAASWDYTIVASVLEVYNETIRDLLKPDPNTKLEVKLKTDGSLNVPGLVKVPISSLEEANRVFQMGRENRAMEATNMNEHSSRSHCLLCISVHGINSLTGDSSRGQLNLVDLAGSERVGKSQAEGPRLKEAQNINRSLASLGDVINALKNKHSHVPYRNSKLTYLLQDSLGGDSKTLMILQASPEEVNTSETVCTLTFGQRVRSAELGAASRHVEGGQKGTPCGVRRTVNHETPLASPTSSMSHKSLQLSGKRKP